MRQACRRVASNRLRALGAAFLFAVLASVALAQAPAEIEATMSKMLSAVQTGSLADFVAAGDLEFRAGMTKPMLDSVSRQLAPRLRQGYTAAFLGKLKQQAFTVYLWKLEFKDGRDDVLVTLSEKGGQVGGFWVQ
jgi:hypothetical protein